MRIFVLLLLAITAALAWPIPLQTNEEDTRMQERQREVEQLAELSGQMKLNTRRSRSRSVFETSGMPSLPVKLQDRIDQTAQELDRSPFIIGNGTGVHIFLLDTGVNATHGEFNTSRASFYFDAITGREKNVTTDTDGHGTKVASVAIGKNIGIARGATLHSLRVAEGVPTAEAETANVILALDKVISWTEDNPQEKCVILFPMTSHHSSALDARFESVSKNTSCVVVVAAGNYDETEINNYDACQFSPGRTNWVITVGATTKTDKRYNLSTYGPCVDIYAPGKRINAAAANGDDKYVNVSGTSIAAAAVAGAAAVILGSYEVTLNVNQTMTDAVKDIIIETSINCISGLPSENDTLPSFNRLLNVENTTVYGSG